MLELQYLTKAQNIFLKIIQWPGHMKMEDTEDGQEAIYKGLVFNL